MEGETKHSHQSSSGALLAHLTVTGVQTTEGRWGRPVARNVSEIAISITPLFGRDGTKLDSIPRYGEATPLPLSPCFSQSRHSASVHSVIARQYRPRRLSKTFWLRVKKADITQTWYASTLKAIRITTGKIAVSSACAPGLRGPPPLALLSGRLHIYFFFFSNSSRPTSGTDCELLLLPDRTT